MNTYYRNSTLYVGDLQPNVTQEDLYKKFSLVAPVAGIRICQDVITKHSLGYAYVNFYSPVDAERALDTMNFKPERGRPMRIMWSMRDPSLRKSGVGNVFIKNLDEGVTAENLYHYCSKFGRILSCKVMTDKKICKGYGFVHFESGDAALHAIKELHGKPIMSKKLYVGNFISRRERMQLCPLRADQLASIFVKNFGDKLDDGKLRVLFEEFGEIISAKVVIDDTGTSKGFGFVNFRRFESAEKAVSTINGRILHDCQLYVAHSQTKAKLEQQRNGANIYVKNLAECVDDNILHDAFKSCGEITSAKVMRECGRSKGFGFVCFSTPNAAQTAIATLHYTILQSKPMYISLAQRKEERRKQLSEKYITSISNLTITPHTSLFQPNDVNCYAPPLPPDQIYYQQQLMTEPETQWQTATPATGPQPSTKPHIDVAPQILAGVQTTAQNPNSLPRQIPPQKGATPKTTTGRSLATNLPHNRTKSGFKSKQLRQLITGAGKLPAGQAEGFVRKPNGSSKTGQKDMLRDNLESVIKKEYPDLDPKICGMLSDLDISEMVNMLTSNVLLKKKVEEALGVLENH